LQCNVQTRKKSGRKAPNPPSHGISLTHEQRTVFAD
jgi:hypothetical protein